MANYSIEFKTSAEKDIRKIRGKKLKQRILDRIERLADDPRPPGCVKLSESDYYRIRVGTYRVVYQIIDDILLVVIVRMAHRKTVYR